MLKGRLYDEIERTLTDLVFIEQKCSFGLRWVINAPCGEYVWRDCAVCSYDLVADYLAVAVEVQQQSLLAAEEARTGKVSAMCLLGHVAGSKESVVNTRRCRSTGPRGCQRG